MQLTPRAYQLAIYHSILQHGNTLVILPTGLGKTLVALLLIREKMKEGKCLFLTPTKPLAKQHLASIKEILGMEDAALLTGEKNAEARKKEYEHAVIVATPQTIRNDFEKGILQPDFSLVIFDESHRAVKEYAYTKIAAALPESCLIVGLTASPGGKRERIEEVLANLKIKNIEIRTSMDDDVKPYVQQSSIQWIGTTLSPTFLDIQRRLGKLISKYAQGLGALGFAPPLKHKGLFMQLRQRIVNHPHPKKYQALKFYFALLHALHMQELIETQGMHAFRSYLERLLEKETKSVRMLLKEEEIKSLFTLAHRDEEHPKLKLLVDLLTKLKGKKCIVFAQYRDQIALLEGELQKHGFAAKRFVGKRQEYTRAMQEETIKQFREGKFDILCATSIGEEGLDIPSVDTVIFYEPVPSEIRSIQRRGRTARLKPGEIYILLTRGTRDEHYYWAAHRKEKKMREIIEQIQRKMRVERGDPVPPAMQKPGQMKLAGFLR